jgi:hypothetical protein
VPNQPDREIMVQSRGQFLNDAAAVGVMGTGFLASRVGDVFVISKGLKGTAGSGE